MGLYTSIEVSASALSAERLAMDVIANNLANANTTRTPEGGTFKRQLVVFAQKQDTPANVTDAAATASDDDAPSPLNPISQIALPGQQPPTSQSGVEVQAIVPADGPDRLVYDPTHPDADAQGYVHYPNIDVVKEMVDMIAASRAYQANVTAIQEARAIGASALNLLKA